MSEEVPELLVEKLALGELSDAEAEAVRARLGDEADARIDAVMRSNAEILEDHPPSEMAAAVRRRLEDRKAERKPARAGWWLALPTLAAAAGLLFWVGTRGPEDVVEGTEPPVKESGESPEVITLKGDPRMIIQRRRGSEDVQVTDGDSVRAGDLLQVSYQAAGSAEGVIISMDGRGVMTLHHPEKPKKASTALQTGGTIPLPNAYELDDAPKYERFFFVTGDHVDVETVATAAVRLSKQADAETANLQLPHKGWKQQSILLRKE